MQNRRFAHAPRLCADIYELYLSHGEFFELEDQVNLAWMLYKTEEYVKAYSPGGMVDGTRVQDWDIMKVPSQRGNPVIADAG